MGCLSNQPTIFKISSRHPIVQSPKEKRNSSNKTIKMQAATGFFHWVTVTQRSTIILVRRR